MPLDKLELQSFSIENNPGLGFYVKSKIYYQALNNKEKQQLLPDISAEYFVGTNSGLNNNIQGYQLGLKIPLFFSGNASRIKASKIAEEIITSQEENYKTSIQKEYQVLLAKLKEHEESIIYYETQGKTLSEEIIKTASRTFKEGEIDFFQYIQSIETAKEIELDYLDNLNKYNQTVIIINHLTL